MSRSVPAGLRFGFQQCAVFIYVLATQLKQLEREIVYICHVELQQ